MDQSNSQPVPKNNLSIPAAIVLAGLLIAGGIILSRPSPSAPANAPAASIDLAPITAADHLLGNPNAPVTIVEYSDLECPFCKMFQSTMQQIMATYGASGTVAWVYRQFPLDSLHPKARHEAEASECAAAEGGNTVFWNYIDEVFATTTSNNTLDPAKLPIIANDVGLNVSTFDTCLASSTYAAVVQAQEETGMKAGAQGTPYSVMVFRAPLSAAAKSDIESYIANNNLSGNVSLSADGTMIALDGALPISVVEYFINAAVK